MAKIYKGKSKNVQLTGYDMAKYFMERFGDTFEQAVEDTRKHGGISTEDINKLRKEKGGKSG